MKVEDMPLVTVITPCYNDGSYILACVKSVQDSDYSRIEHIIVDDGSDAKTKTILSQINYPNVKVIYQNNKGVCEARNVAIRQAQGKFILPVDGDDKIGPHYISQAVRMFNENSNVRLVTSEICQKFDRSNDKLIVSENIDIGTLLSRNLMHISTLFRREDALNVGCFDEDFRIGLEDWAFWVSLLELGGIVGIVPGTNTYYRVKKFHRNNSFSSETQRMLVKLIWTKHKTLYSQYYADPYETDAYISLKQLENMSLFKMAILRMRQWIRKSIL